MYHCGEKYASMCTFLLQNSVLCDMGLVQRGICATGLLHGESCSRRDRIGSGRWPLLTNSLLNIRIVNDQQREGCYHKKFYIVILSVYVIIRLNTNWQWTYASSWFMLGWHIQLLMLSYVPFTLIFHGCWYLPHCQPRNPDGYEYYRSDHMRDRIYRIARRVDQSWGVFHISRANAVSRKRKSIICHYSISLEICTRSLLCCALLWLYIDWFTHIHQAYFTGTVTI